LLIVAEVMIETIMAMGISKEGLWLLYGNSYPKNGFIIWEYLSKKHVYSLGIVI